MHGQAALAECVHGGRHEARELPPGAQPPSPYIIPFRMQVLEWKGA